MRIRTSCSRATRRGWSCLTALALLAGALTIAPAYARGASTEDRRAFDARFYFGLGIDSFAASDLNRYLNPEATNRKLERGVGGFDFEYRLAGQSGRAGQLWVYGETVHGVRSADLDLQSLDSLAAFRLTGFADPGERTLYMLRNATSLEAFGGFRWEFRQISAADAEAVAAVYLYGQYGLLTLAGNGGDVLDLSRYGGGVRCIGGALHGSRLEIGTGQSDFFFDHHQWRFKVNAELDWVNEAMKSRGMGMFTEIAIDSDCGPGSDSVQSYLGFDFDLAHFFSPAR